MALSIVSSQTGKSSSSATVATTSALVDGNAGDIIVVFVNVDAVTSPASVTSISGGGLTWQRRAMYPLQTHSGVAFTDGYVTAEIWWAYAASSFNATITATIGGWSSVGSSNLTMVAFAVTGFTGTAYQTNPWDSNIALPAVAGWMGNSGAATSTPTAAVSTTSANTMVLGFLAFLENTSPTAGSGFTTVNGVLQTSGNNYAYAYVEYENFTSAQNALSIATTGALVNWIFIGDALSVTGSPAPLFQFPIQIYTQVNTALSSGASVTVSANAPAGSTIVLLAVSHNETNETIGAPSNDSAGNSYTQAVQNATVSGVYNASIFYCENAAALTAGTSTINLPTLAGGGADLGFTAFAIPGISTTGVLDKTSSYENASGGAVSFSTGGLNYLGEIVFAALAYATDATTFTEAADFLSINPWAPLNWQWNFAFQIVGTAASVTYNPTATGNSSFAVAAVMASFVGNGAPAAGSTLTIEYQYDLSVGMTD
jgi:hypothetical protein